MATVSGRVIFDRDRSVTVSAGDSGLANIPVVLQDTATGARLTVLTDGAGDFRFDNVPDGSYRVVEAYGERGGTPSPGNFADAAAGAVPVGANPPLSLAANPPPGATNLDSVTPDTLRVVVAGADLATLAFFDGPVIYTPIEAILDPCAVVGGDNLIGGADGGTFGSFPQGTPANTGAPVQPYPGVTPGFTYVLPNPNVYAPAGGEYTVQNILNDAMSAEIGAWWRIADHTAGNETGRMMIVNGDNPGAVFFRSTVTVRPNTNYLFSAWISNLFKVTGYPDPQLGVRVRSLEGDLLYSAPLGALIPVSTGAPEWKQVGAVVNARGYTQLVVELLSEGEEVIGNDYAVDDVAFSEIETPVFLPEKSVDRSAVLVGETVRFTVRLHNPCGSPLTSLRFQDILPDGLRFVRGSVSVNGVPAPDADPEEGFALPDVPGAGAVTVAFSALAAAIPSPNPARNRAVVGYAYTPVQGGIPQEYAVDSNEVAVAVSAREEADLSVVKGAAPNPVDAGSELTFTLTVYNAGPAAAADVLLTDAVPAALANAEYSVDGGASYQPWTGALSLGSLAAGGAQLVLLRGAVRANVTQPFANTAAVESSTYDPDLRNNADTVLVDVINPIADTEADLALTKAAQAAAILPGEELGYTLTVNNLGPDEAEDVMLTDNVPSDLTNVEYSVDGGASYQPWTGTLSLGSLAAGASQEVLLRGTVSAAAAGVISNTATVGSTTPDPDLANNEDTADVTVTAAASADLSVSKTAPVTEIAPGAELTYTLTVSNAGPDEAENVLLTDNLPGEVTNAEYSVDSGASYQPWTGTLSLGSLALGSSWNVLLRGTVSAAAVGAISNTATVGSTTPDPDLTNNADTLEVDVLAALSADLSVSKTAPVTEIAPGAELTYTLTVSNAGPDEAENVEVTDDVPDALENAEYSLDNGASYQTWTGALTLVDALPAGSAFSILLRGTVSAAATGAIINTATVGSTTPDPDLTNNADTVEVDVTAAASADLAVSKTAPVTEIAPGAELTYTLTVSNAGPDEAENVLLTDNLPGDLTNAEYSVDSGASYQPWTGTLSLGSLAAGASQEVLLRGTVSAAATGAISNTATVGSTTPDPDLTNNADTVEVDVVAALSADLSVTKTAPVTEVAPGAELTYTLTVSNAGPDEAENVLLTDNLPGDLTNAEYSVDSGASYQPWTGTLSLGSLAAGASLDVLLRGTVSAAATGAISNTATVGSTTPDPDLTNNADTLEVDVLAALSADLSVSKTAPVTEIAPGAELTYTLTVSNAGPDEAENVLLTDNLPGEVTNAEYSVDSGASYQPWTGTLSLGSLALGSSWNVLLRGTVSAAAVGAISNTATVGSTTPDPDLTNNEDTLEVNVVAALSADLSVSKTAPVTEIAPGAELTYTLTVSNAGPDEAENVEVTDDVPDALENAEYSLDNGASYQTWTGALTLVDALSAGSAFSILLRGTVSAAATGAIINTATVGSTTPDPDLTNNADTVEVDVVAALSADLAVTKTAQVNQVAPGDVLTYTLTVRNLGPDDAQDVMLYDEVPPELGDVEFSPDGGARWYAWSNPQVLDRLDAGMRAELLLRGTVLPTACGTIANTAVAMSALPDPDPRNNADTAVTAVDLTLADLDVAIDAFPNPVCCGRYVTFTLTVRNAGTTAAEGVVICDALPAGLGEAIYSVDCGQCWQAWSGSYALGTLEAGCAVSLLVAGRAEACAGSALCNTACVTAQTADPDPSNNAASVSVCVTDCPCRR